MSTVRFGSVTVRVGPAVALAAAALCAFRCDYFTDLVTPTELSRATVALVVRDVGGPVQGATVGLDGATGVSDASGRVTFYGVFTGTYTASVSADTLRYLPLQRTVDVLVGGTHDTLRLERTSSLPRIDSLVVLPDQVIAANDSVRITFWVRRPAWSSPLQFVRVWFSYPDSADTASVPLEADSAFRSVRHVYNSGGTRTVRVEAFNAEGERSFAERAVVVGTTFRPSVTVSILPPYGFYDSVPNAIDVRVTDPDAVTVPQIIIYWGDGSSPQVYGSYGGLYSHMYAIAPSSASIDTFLLTVTARDGTGLEDVHHDELIVGRTPGRLVVGSQLVFIPDSTVDSSVATVTIGLTVLSTPGYVDTVAWYVNRFDTVPEHVLTAVSDLNSTSGAVAPGGRYFEASFPLTSLPATNYVQMLIKDSYGQTAAPHGRFYITGR